MVDIVAVVVIYEPDISALIKLISRVNKEVKKILIVDNSLEPNKSLKLKFRLLDYVKLDLNCGIAYAHNIGFEWALKNRAKYVLLLDQDSMPVPGMVRKLKDALENVFIAGQRPSVAGPLALDPKTKKSTDLSFTSKALNFKNKKILPTQFLIASGMLIETAVVKKVGGMRSGYFIDHADSEWTLRLNAMGFYAVLVSDAIMWHQLGSGIKRIWFLKWRNVIMHSPYRNYYKMRNNIFMLKHVQMPFIFNLKSLFSLLKFFIYFGFVDKERYSRFKFIITGFIHGLYGMDGYLDPHLMKCRSIPHTKLDPSFTQTIKIKVKNRNV
jgi:rhamnosyltransferase